MMFPTALIVAASLLVPIAYGQEYGGAASSTASATESAPSSSSTSNVINVDVGRNGLTFSPDTVNAAVGQTVDFHYFPKNHSVVQSTFNNPCHPMEGGIYSGFFPTQEDQNSQMFSVTINTTDAIWIYCSQTKFSHCQSGMVMVINPPSSSGANTLDAYRSAAAAMTENSTSPATVSGGVIVANVDSSSSSSTDGASSSSSSSSTSTASGTEGAASASATGDAGVGMKVQWAFMGMAMAATVWAGSLM